MQSGEWAQRFTKQIGDGIEAARGKRSDQWIADRTAQIGHPLSRMAVSEYRRGVRKTMSVTDWLAIAAALGVPPVSLLFPNLPNGPVELLPKTWDPAAFDALQWVCGERQTIPEGMDALIPLDEDELPGGDAVVRKLDYRSLLDEYAGDMSMDLRLEGDPSPELQLLRLCRKLADLYRSASDRHEALWKAIVEKDDQAVEREKALTELLGVRKENLENQIRELGGDLDEPQVIQGDEEDSDGAR